MRHQKRFFVVALLVAAVSLVGLANAAQAEQVHSWTQKVGEMKKECKESGGVYSPPVRGGAATCLESDGSVTTCKKNGKNNCTNVSERRADPGSTDPKRPPVVKG